MKFLIYGKTKNVPNHQPVMVLLKLIFRCFTVPGLKIKKKAFFAEVQNGVPYNAILKHGTVSAMKNTGKGHPINPISIQSLGFTWIYYF